MGCLRLQCGLMPGNWVVGVGCLHLQGSLMPGNWLVGVGCLHLQCGLMPGDWVAGGMSIPTGWPDAGQLGGGVSRPTVWTDAGPFGGGLCGSPGSSSGFNQYQSLSPMYQPNSPSGKPAFCFHCLQYGSVYTITPLFTLTKHLL